MNLPTEDVLGTLSLEEAGRLLGISRATAYRLAKNGEIPYVAVGHKRRVPKLALLRLLEGAVQKGESEE